MGAVSRSNTDLQVVTKMARPYFAMILSIMLWSLDSTTAALASGKLQYGSRVGMTVSIISMSGLSTANAVIRTKHTQEDAVSFCRNYVGKVTQKCIQKELATPLNDSVAANCPAGEFTDFYGRRYQFLGPNKNLRDDTVKYLIRDQSSGEFSDGSNASGYPVNMQIFKALCPRQAP